MSRYLDEISCRTGTINGVNRPSPEVILVYFAPLFPSPNRVHFFSSSIPIFLVDIISSGTRKIKNNMIQI